MKTKYYGVYDHKESNTFRPTLEKRIHKDYPYSKTIMCRDDSCCVITRGGHNMRIRKLTPKECCRLMGFDDKDYEAMKEAGLSDSAIYHCCGDSIVVSTLMMIFSKLTNDNEGAYREQIEKYVDGIANG